MASLQTWTHTAAVTACWRPTQGQSKTKIQANWRGIHKVPTHSWETIDNWWLLGRESKFSSGMWPLKDSLYTTGCTKCTRRILKREKEHMQLGESWGGIWETSEGKEQWSVWLKYIAYMYEILNLNQRIWLGRVTGLREIVLLKLCWMNMSKCLNIYIYILVLPSAWAREASLYKGWQLKQKLINKVLRKSYCRALNEALISSLQTPGSTTEERDQNGCKSQRVEIQYTGRGGE